MQLFRKASWAIAAMFAAALSACGGGAATGAGGSGSSTPTAGIAATQAWANNAVAAVNAGVSAVSAAAGTGPIHLLASDVASQLNLATATTSIDCSAFGTSGSGTIGYHLTLVLSAGNLVPETLTLTVTNCTWTSGADTYLFNGTATIDVTNWTSASNWSSTESWSLTYSVTNGATTNPYSFDGSSACTYSGGSGSCSDTVGNFTVAPGASASASGGVTTESATVETTVSGVSGTADFTLVGWAYDAGTLAATAGSVNVSDALGNTATITVSGSGSYTVTVTVGGSTNSFTVT